MHYAYNHDVSGVVNGVMFFFDKGDEKIAIDTLRVVNLAKELPTSVVWEGLHVTPLEALQIITVSRALDQGYLGIRFTIDESSLLKQYLNFLKQNYSTLIALVNEIDSKVFGVRN